MNICVIFFHKYVILNRIHNLIYVSTSTEEAQNCGIIDAPTSSASFVLLNDGFLFPVNMFWKHSCVILCDSL